jgi:hypothetical protein
LREWGGILCRGYDPAEFADLQVPAVCPACARACVVASPAIDAGAGLVMVVVLLLLHHHS